MLRSKTVYIAAIFALAWSFIFKEDQVCLGQTHQMGISWFSTNPSANMSSIIDMSTHGTGYTMENCLLPEVLSSVSICWW